ncbi:hypothetical protein BXZ70DRAFT_1005351 [Cristinia sonorae]|uniref:Uncharacterized protein n=1 Tax=Cristinia sonorae TaxID=1940300 RepID=A0A8K0XT14_9AGAR|nr:hypothetical protein BXZ70DRAFT_1005351 [Cristinia sonorae]
MAPHQQETIYQTPPLAGRPPFATDDDSVYDNQPQQQSTRRLRQPPPPDPNARSSAYNVYDNYLDGNNRDSGIGALGSTLMNGDMDDDDDDDPFDDDKKAPSFDAPRQQQHYQQQQATIPLAAPKPGYAAPVGGLKLAPSPATSPTGRTPSPQQMAQIQVPRPLMLVNSMNDPGSPRNMSPAISVPNTPHPLQAPMTPIQPAFVRPAPASPRDVKFATARPILRGNQEETMLPKRGERGDDFWRRFSMVVKEESAKPKGEKQSVWLRKTQSGSTRMSRWVWIVGVILLLCIAGGIGLGWWIAHNDKSVNAPTAIGGSANEKAQPTTTAAAPGTSSAARVTPTHTVARRAATFDIIPTQAAQLSSHPLDRKANRAQPPVQPIANFFSGRKSHLSRSRHRRITTNRTIDA